MNSPVKIFYYRNGSVRVITETQIAYFTKKEWEAISRSFGELFK